MAVLLLVLGIVLGLVISGMLVMKDQDAKIRELYNERYGKQEKGERK